MKKIFQLITFLAFLLFAKTAYAQLNEGVLLEGKIISDKKNPVPYANICVYQNDKFITGTVSNPEGFFSIKITYNKEQTYSFLVSCIGYENNKKIITPSDIKNTFTIVLKETSSTLQEVVVEGVRHLITPTLEGYTISTKELRKSRNNAFDLLSVLPNITTKDDVLRVLGKGNLLLKINNRLMRVSDGELTQILKGFDAGLIDQVEVQNQPPTRYNQDGNTAMIILKTSNKFTNYIGGSIATETQLSKRTKSIHPYGMFIYNKEKFSSLLNLAHTYEHRTARDLTMLENPLYSRKDNGFSKNDITFPYLYMSAQYDYSKTGDVGISVNLMNEGQDIGYDNQITFGKSHFTAIDSIAISKKKTKADKLRFSTVAYWEHQLKQNGMKIWADVSFYTYTKKDPEDYTSILFEGDDLHKMLARNQYEKDEDIKVSGWGAKVDYYAPLDSKKLWILEAGSNLLINKTANNKNSNESIRQSYKYDYNENSINSYLSLNISPLENMSITLGSSLPINDRRGCLDGENIFEKTDVYFLPYFRASYMLNQKHSFYLNYGQAVSYPSFFQLNPFNWKINPYSEQRGNTSLSPVKMFSGNFSYSYLSRISFGAYYTYSKDVISEVLRIDPSTNIHIYQMMNAQNGHNAGVNASYFFNRYSWFQASISGYAGWVSYSSTLSQSEQSIRSSNVGFNLNSSFVFNKSRTLIGGLTFSYQNRTKDVVKTLNAQYGLQLYLSAFFLDRRLNVRLAGLDLFKPNLKGKYFANNTAVAYNYKQIAPKFFLNLTYRFGNAESKRYSRSKSNQAIEQRLE